MKINGKENQAPKNDSSLVTNEDSATYPKTHHYKHLENLRLIKKPFELMVPDDEFVTTSRS
jgi:hypothetical protein